MKCPWRRDRLSYVWSAWKERQLIGQEESPVGTKGDEWKIRESNGGTPVQRQGEAPAVGVRAQWQGREPRISEERRDGMNESRIEWKSKEPGTATRHLVSKWQARLCSDRIRTMNPAFNSTSGAERSRVSLRTPMLLSDRMVEASAAGQAFVEAKLRPGKEPILDHVSREK